MPLLVNCSLKPSFDYGVMWTLYNLEDNISIPSHLKLCTKRTQASTQDNTKDKRPLSFYFWTHRPRLSFESDGTVSASHGLPLLVTPRLHETLVDFFVCVGNSIVFFCFPFIALFACIEMPSARRTKGSLLKPRRTPGSFFSRQA